VLWSILHLGSVWEFLDIPVFGQNFSLFAGNVSMLWLAKVCTTK